MINCLSVCDSLHITVVLHTWGGGGGGRGGRSACIGALVNEVETFLRSRPKPVFTTEVFPVGHTPHSL